MFEGERSALLGILQGVADPRMKAWWEAYVKDGPPFIGVKMPIMRTSLRRWREGLLSEDPSPGSQLDLALSLFEGEYAEEKLAGTPTFPRSSFRRERSRAGGTSHASPGSSQRAGSMTGTFVIGSA